MTTGSSHGGRTIRWFERNRHRLFAADVVSVMLLFFMHLSTSTIQLFTQEIVVAIQFVAMASAVFLVLSVVSKGVLPLLICAFGIVLLYHSVVLPYSVEPEVGQGVVWLFKKPINANAAAHMHFALGAGMVGLSMIIAYRPSVLFTRNRPESLENEWSKYPLWKDNTLLAEGGTERSIPVKSLMNDQDRYLLWRYEYVLALIYDTPHLVKPNGLVPKDSTLVRDRESGRVIGKARYTGFFM